jgi:hypothetical protein
MEKGEGREGRRLRGGEESCCLGLGLEEGGGGMEELLENQGDTG